MENSRFWGLGNIVYISNSIHDIKKEDLLKVIKEKLETYHDDPIYSNIEYICLYDYSDSGWYGTPDKPHFYIGVIDDGHYYELFPDYLYGRLYINRHYELSDLMGHIKYNHYKINYEIRVK